MDYKKLAFACAIFFVAQIMSWFQLNSQFVWDFWKGRPVLAVIVYGVPCGLSFWYGWRLCNEAMGNTLWGTRFVGYCVSYMVFPFLTYYFMGESMFTFKTLSCIFLSVCILLIQIFA